MSKKGIIIGAGEFEPTSFRKLNYEEETYMLIVADGGLEYVCELGLFPDLIIGDFDSIKKENMDYISRFKQNNSKKMMDIITLPTHKNDTDLLAGIRVGLEKGIKEFHIFGGTGGRFDHTLANIQCLIFLKNQGAVGYLYSKEQVMTVIKDEKKEFDFTHEGIVSLFAMGEIAQKVTLEGLKYPLKEYTITNDFPIGISNEFMGKNATVEVKKGSLLVIWNQ